MSDAASGTAFDKALPAESLDNASDKAQTALWGFEDALLFEAPSNSTAFPLNGHGGISKPPGRSSTRARGSTKKEQEP